MPNERLRRRKARRAKPASPLRVAPLVLFGLMAAAVVDRHPSPEGPIRWTMRDADAWMAEFDPLREARFAGTGTMARLVDVAPLAPTAAPSPVATVAPGLAAAVPMVVAEADVAPRPEAAPRDVPKRVPLDVEEPEITGAVPGGRRLQAPAEPRLAPTINRGGKGDRLFSPQPYGRTTEGDVFVKPTLAVVPPSLEGWPPLVTLASLTAPHGERTLPRLALAPTPKGATDGIVVAMVRSGPGRVVTQSAIAALGTNPAAARTKGRAVLPPVPDQVAAGPRVGQPGAAVQPEMGFARRTDIETRFRAVLGDGDAGFTPAGTPDDQLPP